jgi:phage shock protein PspC (stress-responsive transcriptional regulator)
MCYFYPNSIFNPMAKRLVKGEKKLFGVCSGLANYFDVDPTLVRALFIITFLMVGTGGLAYIILAIIMPDK